jgi:hypothetical protein
VKLGLWTILLVVVACVPLVPEHYSASAAHSSSLSNCGRPVGLRFKLLHGSSIDVSIPDAPISHEAIEFSVEVPADHVLQWTSAVVELSSDESPAQWQGLIEDRGGLRYLGAGSSSMDAAGGNPERALVGSTWHTHWSSETVHSDYAFDVRGDRRWPKRFTLQLPPILIDGVKMDIPAIRFQFGRQPYLQGLACT